jgi:hypothetical protein
MDASVYLPLLVRQAASGGAALCKVEAIAGQCLDVHRRRLMRTSSGLRARGQAQSASVNPKHNDRAKGDVSVPGPW